MVKYKRILLKISGEALAGDSNYGFDPQRINLYASQIKEITELGVQTGIVTGGGNIFRGFKGLEEGVDRVRGDHMGMLATVINGLALQSLLEKKGVRVNLLTSIPMGPVAEGYSKSRALEAFRNGSVVIFAGGTGNPFFTTDTAAALRAVETECEVLLKGTRVDGVFTADPEKDPTAVRYETITFGEAYEKNLKIMDLTAFTLCRENNLPIVVFNMNKSGNLLKIVRGESTGTLVSS